ncbi:hypothetical protein VU13_05345 [Desulfobulbus sp. US5]|nr:hypothetical protein [Desulfobulbus sp. US5]
MSIGKKSPSLIFETMELLIVLAKIFAGLALLIFSISQLSHTLKKFQGSDSGRSLKEQPAIRLRGYLQVLLLPFWCRAAV